MRKASAPARRISSFDAIVSKEINQRVELSGYGGFIVRGDPDDVELLQRVPLGFRRRLPDARGLRLTAELHGETQFDDVVYSGSGIAAEDRVVSAAGV